MSKSLKLDDKQILGKLAKDFHELVSNKEVLRTAVENFLHNAIDDLTLGIIFDLHRKYKTKSHENDVEEEDGDDDEAGEADFFVQHDIKKTQECVCPNCDRAVAATRFAPHLETCMGMGRNRFRNATRRVNNANNTTTTSNSNSTSINHSKERETPSASVPSDDDDDMDWNPGSKRGAIKREYKKKRNGNKKLKTGGTPKKPSDSSNIDMDEDDDLSSLRELLQDHSNSSSPADSVSSSHSNSSRKKEKTKTKKTKRDKSSPSSNLSVE